MAIDASPGPAHPDSLEELLGQVLRLHADGDRGRAGRLWQGHVATLILRNQLDPAWQAMARLRAQGKLLQDAPDRQAAAAALAEIGNAFWLSGRGSEAEACCREALALHADHAHAHNNLGVILFRSNPAEAQACFRRALQANSALPVSWRNLGLLLSKDRRFDDAESCYRRALALRPDYADAHNSLGVALLDTGRPVEAGASFRCAVELDSGNAMFRSNMLQAGLYLPGKSSEDLLAEHRQFGLRFERHPHGSSDGIRREADRDLRIGYVSGDLRAHSVALFLEPILANHRRPEFEVFCYSNGSESDGVTRRLQSHSAHWREVHALTDEEMAARVREDGIDILVDLSGHSALNRLPVFARKPAPVQMTYLGYPATTGLPAIDFRLTDAVADPVGRSDACHTERLLRLPRTAWCYRPHDGLPEVGPSPLAAIGAVTFGSMNQVAKLNRPLVALWARLLARVPEARFVATGIPQGGAQMRLAAQFAEAGIPSSRLELHDRLPRESYDALLARVDIALDSFPYGGTTTTCDLLWMGVPVVSLAGASAASRSGASLLKSVGLEDLVAGSPEAYLEIAIALAGDGRRLAVLRSGARQRMRASPLMDAGRFTLALEECYREAWHGYCRAP